MTKENQIEFKSFDSRLVFEVQDWDNLFEQEVPFSCGEDLEYIFKLYLDKNWKELFEGLFVDHKKIYSVLFKGFRMYAKDNTTNNKLWIDVENREYARVTIDYDVLGDVNANKIDEIRKIVSR